MIQLDDIAELDFRTLVRPGDAVVCGQALGEPAALTRRLMAQRREIGPFRLFIGPTYHESIRPDHADVVGFRSYCGTARNALLAAAGALDVLPAHYSDIARLYAARALPADVVLLTAGEPDGEERFNLGLQNDYVIEAARAARMVVIEVVPGVPWVFGAELPADIRPHIIVRTRRELLTVEPGAEAEAGAAEQAIARHVASRVPDGATLQMGIGVLPDLVLRALRDRRDLGIHSALIGDGAMELMEAGVVTNARKPIGRGVTICGMLIGSRRLLDYAHRNPRIRLVPAAETNSIEILGRLPNFVSLNGAVEVDLSGQVNAERAGGRHVGAIGGQVEFVRGAAAAPGGRSLILVPATAKGGQISRIVPRLGEGVVTTPRCDVDAVVTEYGIAELRGRTLAERARAMIAIAHPNFRDTLARAAAGA